MAAADFGLQVTRQDGRVMFDSRTWGPCVFDWLDTSQLPYTLVNGFDRRFSIAYPARVTVMPSLIQVDNVPSPNGVNPFPKITVLSSGNSSVVTIELSESAADCKLLVVGE